MYSGSAAQTPKLSLATSVNRKVDTHQDSLIFPSWRLSLHVCVCVSMERYYCVYINDWHRVHPAPKLHAPLSPDTEAPVNHLPICHANRKRNENNSRCRHIEPFFFCMYVCTRLIIFFPFCFILFLFFLSFK